MREWEQCSPGCSAITGAESSSYRITSASIGDKLRVTVTAVSSQGNPTASSAETETVTAGPPVSGVTTTLSGEPVEGKELKVSNGSWYGTAPFTYAYAWERCGGSGCKAISGATASGYTATSADVGQYLRATVTATNTAGSASATSEVSESISSATGSAAVTWGENYWGQLGQWYRDSNETWPVGLQGLNQITELSEGSSFSLARLSTGEVLGWGGNKSAQLGDGSTTDPFEEGRNHVPVTITEATEVSAANSHPLAKIGSGPTSTVDTWGPNGYGQHGNGHSGFEHTGTPTAVGGIEGVGSIATGGGDDFVVLESGEVKAWGDNKNGALSVESWPSICDKRSTCTGKENEERFLCNAETGKELCSNLPRYVVNKAGERLKSVKKVVAGGEAAYALFGEPEKYEVMSWGNNLDGALGQEIAGEVKAGVHSTFTAPGWVVRENSEKHLERLKGVKQLSAGFDHAIALLESGEVVVWGDDSEKELGEGTPETCASGSEHTCFKVARRLKGLESAEEKHEVEMVAAGGKYSIALVNHKVYVWGKNGNGELSNGSNSSPAECKTKAMEEKFIKKREKDEESTAKKIKEVEEGKLKTKTVEQLERQLKQDEAALENEEGHQAACSGKPLLVHLRGAETETGWEAGPALEHVARIEAGTTSGTAILEPGVRPPAPIASLRAGEAAGKRYVGFKWPGSGVSRVLVHRYEGGESGELGEGASCEEADPEACVGSFSETGPPVNVSLPHVKHNGKVEEPEIYREGQAITAFEGFWEGAKMEFAFQWERCPVGGECEPVSGATEPDYELGSLDVGSRMRVTISATNGEGGPVSAQSAETAVVKTPTGVRKEQGESLKIEGVKEVTLTELGGAGFEEIPYEINLTYGEKSLHTVVTPGKEAVTE